MASISVYNKFITNNVFEKKSINVFCNQLVEAISKKFDISTDKFGIGGEAANCLINEIDGPIENICFITSSLEVYKFISKNIILISPNVEFCEAYQEKIIIFIDEIYVEFFFQEEISIIDIDGIPVVEPEEEIV